MLTQAQKPRRRLVFNTPGHTLFACQQIIFLAITWLSVKRKDFFTATFFQATYCWKQPFQRYILHSSILFWVQMQSQCISFTFPGFSWNSLFSTNARQRFVRRSNRSRDLEKLAHYAFVAPNASNVRWKLWRNVSGWKSSMVGYGYFWPLNTTSLPALQRCGTTKLLRT